MIKLQNKISVESSSSSMSDLVFLLLIFFMITSTLISPNAIPLNLPESSSDTRVKQDGIYHLQPYRLLPWHRAL